MFDLTMLHEGQQAAVVNALHIALSVADTYPMLFELYDEREKPTAAEATVTTEFIRHVLAEQAVPTGWGDAVATIITSITDLVDAMLVDEENGKASVYRSYGVHFDSDSLEYLTKAAKLIKELAGKEKQYD